MTPTNTNIHSPVLAWETAPLEVRVYWAKREALERAIVALEASLAPQVALRYVTEREIRDALAADLKATREALEVLGQPPGADPSANEAGHKLSAVIQLCRRGQSILAFIDGLAWALHALAQDEEWALERWALAERHRSA